MDAMYYIESKITAAEKTQEATNIAAASAKARREKAPSSAMGAIYHHEARIIANEKTKAANNARLQQLPDNDKASINTTSTFGSTVELVKQKFGLGRIRLEWRGSRVRQEIGGYG